MHTISSAPKKLNRAFVLDESGATAVIFALIFTTICGFAALAFDVGHIIMVRAELQRTADAAALGGVTGLVPYSNPGPNQSPYWANAEAKAHTLIHATANESDNLVFSSTEGTVISGYYLLNPPSGYEQTLPQARPTTAAYLPEPAVKVTLTENVTLYFAPLVGATSPQTVSATATAILPEAYSVSGLPPIAVSWDTVYNTTGGTVVIDVSDQDIKIQSNKGEAGWFNLDGGNSVPSVLYSDPLTSASDQIYLVPGTKATLTGLVSEGQTIVIPLVETVSQKIWAPIIGFAAFKIDSLGSNSIEGHFVNQYFDPSVLPTAGSGTIGGVSGTPKLVSPN
jgi:Flp pilus assembly protein TadG